MRKIISAVALITVLPLSSGAFSPAAADGALAVGLPADVAKDGFAYGGGDNFENADIARQRALERCKNGKGVPKAAAECRIIGTFKNECVAISVDPQPGTPGVGWAFGPDKATADQRAIANCQTTSRSERKQFCAISHSSCDGAANVASAKTPGPAEQAASAAPPSTTMNATVTSNIPAAETVFGRWRWRAKCPVSGNWSGVLQLKGSTQRITGSISQNEPISNPILSRSITDGHVAGRTVVLTDHMQVFLGMYDQTWTGSLNGSGPSARISGQIAASVETCTFTASR